MRVLFFVLLLVNALLFVWAQGYFATGDATREPDRLQRQMDAEKLRILNGGNPASEPKQACKRVEVPSADAERLLKAAAALSGWKADLQPIKPVTTYWVAIPELASRALAEKKKTELRQLGVTEGNIVEDVIPGPFAVSLGQYPDAAAADEFLQGLGRKGVRSARVVQRSIAERFMLEVHVPEADVTEKITQWLEGVTHDGVTDCPAP